MGPPTFCGTLRIQLLLADGPIPIAIENSESLPTGIFLPRNLQNDLRIKNMLNLEIFEMPSNLCQAGNVHTPDTLKLLNKVLPVQGCCLNAVLS